MLTSKQMTLARHALGLPNSKRTTYRNRYVCQENDSDWQDMVARGMATMRRGETLPFGGDACFYMTRQGAEAALELREKLCPEDFPIVRTSPILFSAPMIRAIYDGRKTQTRRGMKVQPRIESDGLIFCGDELSSQHPNSIARLIKDNVRYAVGDRLWVREAWRCNGWATDVATIFYKAHENCCHTEMCEQFPVSGQKIIQPSQAWKPSIHMPRWISRLTLTVTDIRIERLQDISEEDAIAEGAPLDTSFCDHPRHTCAEVGCLGRTHKANFCNIWNEINGATAWDATPWVIALTFRVQHGNIDTAPS